ncbi:MAG: S1 RNA-binding domain-containing protein [Oscillospiraceae bacterium]|nr:S1 RNA-binding domain-containing protein [Oscillospiraceae bacterium]
MMTNIMQESLERIRELIENETVCWAEVARLAHTKKKEHYLMLTMPRMLDHGIKGGERCVIFDRESDHDAKSLDQARSRLLPLLGRKVPFVVLEVDEENGWLICSRRRAQELLKKQMERPLKDGHVFEGEVTGFSDYGAFIDVNGVAGYIRNGDFSDDHSGVQEFFSVGDKMEVRCKEFTDDGAIFLEVVKKYRRDKPIEHDFEPKSIVMGKVTRINTFAQGVGVFVNLKLGIDALCSVPRDLEVEEGSRVLVKIDTIVPGKQDTDPPRIRGKIIRVQ